MEQINAPILLRMKFKESGGTSLLDLSSFVYDFNLLYDFSVILSLDRYKEFKFSRFFWYRKGRHVVKDDMLYLKKIQHKSPLEIVVIVGAVTAIGILVKVIEKIKNWDINREKLRLEVENLRLDNDQKYMINQKMHLELENELEKRDALITFNKILKRLDQSGFQATSIEIYNESKDDSDGN